MIKMQAVIVLVGLIVGVSARATEPPVLEKTRACLMELSARALTGPPGSIAFSNDQVMGTVFPGSALAKGGADQGMYVMAIATGRPDIPRQYFCQAPDPKSAKGIGSLMLKLPLLATDLDNQPRIGFAFQDIKQGKNVLVLRSKPKTTKSMPVDCSLIGESDITEPARAALLAAARHIVPDVTEVCNEQIRKVNNGEYAVRGACCAGINSSKAVVNSCANLPLFQSVRSELEKDQFRKLSALSALWKVHHCADGLAQEPKAAPIKGAAPAK